MPDFLFDQMKKNYPELSDEEVVAKIQSVDQPLQAPPQESPYKEMAIEQVKQKYLGDKYNDASRQKVLDANKADAARPSWGAALGAIGAGFSGTDPNAAANSILARQKSARDQKLTEFDSGRNAQLADLKTGQDLTKFGREEDLIKREGDIGSQETILAQSLGKKMSPSTDFSQMNAKQINAALPSLKNIYEIEQRKIDRSEGRRVAEIGRDEARANTDRVYQEKRADKLDDKAVVQEQKKKVTLNEVEDRRRNIEDNLTLLENQIKDRGTYEMFGSHNVDLDRRVEAIATDMAKLADPNSVARPSEVEAFKRGLIQSGATNMRNSTALDILKNFRGEVGRRAKNAYAIRGIENPGASENRTTSEDAVKPSWAQ